MKITVRDERRGIAEESRLAPGLKKLLITVCKKCLSAENFKYEADIGILVTDNNGICNLNREHRGIDKPTDVLSFPLQDIRKGMIGTEPHEYDYTGGNILLGDVVVSYEKVIEQARQFGHSIEREAAFLVSHGVFHLLGYDHDTPDSEAEMEGKQEKVLDSMGLARGKPAGDTIIGTAEGSTGSDMKAAADLAARAAAAMGNAYAPYSGFRVGAAVIDEKGRIFTGCNVENVSYGCTCCAERTAVYKAISEGAAVIKAVAVASDSRKYIYPCGICRQVISEFACGETVIICSRNDGRYRIYSMSALMPHAFGRKAGLLSVKKKASHK